MSVVVTKQRGERLVPWISAMADHSHRTLTCIAETDFPVLLMGERGVGKRTTALEIHARSRRSRQPFREFPCQDLDPPKINSVLKTNGMAYLAEVGDLSLELQEHLMKVYFFSSQAPNCRILFGSTHELLEDVKASRMGEDFFYLVSAITLRISPLRMRKGEIPGIADGLLSQYSKQFERPKPSLSKEVIEFLMTHTWPENFCELETAIKTLVVIGNQSISLAALRAAATTERTVSYQEALPLKEATRKASARVERELIAQVLGSNGGNRKRTANELGISYKTLLYKIKQVGLQTPSRFGVTT